MSDMSLYEAIRKGIRKPCKHTFNNFQVYKKVWKTLKHPNDSNAMRAMIKSMTNPQYRYNKRWIADCPICGKLWLSDTNKKMLVSKIRGLNKEYIEITAQESIRGIKENKGQGEQRDEMSL
jgi:hypothetical protein